MDLASVETLTGLSREVLRKWEARYGFPVPKRGLRGERIYSAGDVERLKVINMLLSRGLRPRNVVHLSFHSLRRKLSQFQSSALQPGGAAAAAELINRMVSMEDSEELGRWFKLQIAQYGLDDFVMVFLPEFNLAVGNAWAEGKVSIFAEHHYSNTVEDVVKANTAKLPESALSPRVLITTPPNELHTLGCLMLEAALRLQGAACTSLGAQTPACEVASAASAMGGDVVAISISGNYPAKAAKAYVKSLRKTLPRKCVLWVGGAGAQNIQTDKAQGLIVMDSVRQAAECWLEMQ